MRYFHFKDIRYTGPNFSQINQVLLNREVVNFFNAQGKQA